MLLLLLAYLLLPSQRELLQPPGEVISVKGELLKKPGELFQEEPEELQDNIDQLIIQQSADLIQHSAKVLQQSADVLQKSAEVLQQPEELQEEPEELQDNAKVIFNVDTTIAWAFYYTQSCFTPVMMSLVASMGNGLFSHHILISSFLINFKSNLPSFFGLDLNWPILDFYFLNLW